MADTAVAITAGTGTNIDTRTEATNGNHRQVIVIGDPATNAGVAPVDATNGLAVYNVQALTVASHAVTNAGTFATQATLAAETTKNIGTVRIGDGTDTAAVMPASTAPATTDTALVVSISPNSQLPAVANNADAVATSGSLLNTAVASYLYGYNGTTFDRLQVDASKFLKTAVSAALPAGTNAIGKLAANAGVDIGDVSSKPSVTGGLSCIYFLDIDESPTSQEVKATAGCLYKLRITNRSTGVRYVKLYNATAASTTVGTTTPLDVIPVPANASDYTVITESFGGLGLTFSTALTIAATTGFADADVGAPGLNDVIVSAYYK